MNELELTGRARTHIVELEATSVVAKWEGQPGPPPAEADEDGSGRVAAAA